MDLPSTDSYLELILMLIFGLVLFNLFLGFIIDSFAEIRAKREGIELSLQQRCFVCDLSRQDFEQHRIDFLQHI